MARGGLWSHADFMRLWTAQAISAFGSRITRTALPIIAVEALGEPATIVGLLVALQLAPGVLVSMFCGGYVDRGRKRRILIAADAIRALAVASLTISWALGALSVLQLIIVGAIVAAASSVFQVADAAYLPALLAPGQLIDGNSKLATTEAVAEITGPASAGVLISVLGAPAAVALDAASYVWSAVWLGRIRTPDLRAATGEDAAGARGDLAIGMRAAFGHPQVRPALLALMAWSIAGGFFSSLYPMFCLRELGISESVYGVIIALGGIGSLGGAVLSRRLGEWLGIGKAMIVTATISLSSLLLIPMAHANATGFVLLGAHQLIGDCFAVAFVIQAMSLRQAVLPVAVLGRANAAIVACTTGVLTASALVAGWLGATIGIRDAVWVGVLTGLVGPLFLSSMWRFRELPPTVSAVATV